MNTVALAAIFAPSLWALIAAPPQVGLARKVWSVVLQKGTWQAMNTGSEYASARQLVFAGDRVIAVFDAGMAGYDGKQPMSNYRVISLDRATGEVKNSLQIRGQWGGMPFLYATNRGHVVLMNHSSSLLNPDLSSAGDEFNPERGMVIEISPDGTTLALQTLPGTTLLESETFKAKMALSESDPTSVSSRAAITNNGYYTQEYPKDSSFITFTDQLGSHMIFHGRCGDRPNFLTNERILTVGCGSFRILDTEGRLMRENGNIDGAGTFGGVSQDGRRFALQSSEGEGDSSELLYEQFIIYDTETAMPVARVDVSDLPERQSWSAFSPDGHLFVVGNPNRLALYNVP